MNTLETINKNKTSIIAILVIVFVAIALYTLYKKFLAPTAGSSAAQQSNVDSLPLDNTKLPNDISFYNTLADSIYSVLDSSLWITDGEVQDQIITPLSNMSKDEVVAVYKGFGVRPRTHFGIPFSDKMNLRAFVGYSLNSTEADKVYSILTSAGL
jgi:hypothetical protein